MKKKWADVFQIYSNAIHFNPLQFCPTHYKSPFSRQANLDLSRIYLILTNLSLRSLSITQIWEQFFKCFIQVCLFFRLILSQPITTSIFVKSTGNFCRLSGLLLRESWNFTNLRFCSFGLTSAPYVFTKVVRQLVKYWRGRGNLVLMYLDDGTRGDMSVESARILSVKILLRLVSQLTTTNQFGNYSEVSFPGILFRFWRRFNSDSWVSHPQPQISLVSCLHNNQILARDLASVTGQIISMAFAVDNITRLFTRNCYVAIECRSSWDQLLHVSPEVRYELSFWLNNIDSITVPVRLCHLNQAQLVLFTPMPATLVLVVILCSVAWI